MLKLVCFGSHRRARSAAARAPTERHAPRRRWRRGGASFCCAAASDQWRSWQCTALCTARLAPFRLLNRRCLPTTWWVGVCLPTSAPPANALQPRPSAWPRCRRLPGKQGWRRCVASRKWTPAPSSRCLLAARTVASARKRSSTATRWAGEEHRTRWFARARAAALDVAASAEPSTVRCLSSGAGPSSRGTQSGRTTTRRSTASSRQMRTTR